VHLVGFYYKNISWCTVLWMSNSFKSNMSLYWWRFEYLICGPVSCVHWYFWWHVLQISVVQTLTDRLFWNSGDTWCLKYARMLPCWLVKTYRCQEVQEAFFFDCLMLKVEALHNIPEDLNLFSCAVRTLNVALYAVHSTADVYSLVHFVMLLSALVYWTCEILWSEQNWHHYMYIALCFVDSISLRFFSFIENVQ
jgi:hypothetical protein